MAEYINPAMGWCYAPEDLMQTVRRLIASCLSGSRPAESLIKAMHKYADGLSMALRVTDFDPH